MKLVITESQIDNIIFQYLDNQDFIIIDTNGSIYFVNSESDEDAEVRYNKDDGWCYIYYKLVEEISTFFSLQDSDSRKVIGRWVENTLQMKVTNTLHRLSLTQLWQLRIPN